MNPYDAILEQLRKAQQRGVETVSNRLDFVLESLEAVIKEAKEAVKEAVPEEPDELFPLGECSRAVDEARVSLETAESRIQELEGRLRELESQVAEASGRGGALSLEVLRRLDAARSQSELLRELLPSLLDHVGRAAVLVIREGTVSAWSGIGFEVGDRLRDWSARAVQSPVLEKFVHENSVVRFSPEGDELFESWLEGEAVPSEAVIIPVVLRGRTVGGIYADRLEGAPWDVEAAQVMVATACWLIDTLSLRTTVPTPTLQEPVEIGEEAPAGQAEPEGGPETREEAVAPSEETTPEAGYPPVVEAEGFRRADREPAGEYGAGAAEDGESAAQEAAGEAAPEPTGEAPGEMEASVAGLEGAPAEPGETGPAADEAATIQVEGGAEWDAQQPAEEAVHGEEPPEPPAVEPEPPAPVEPVMPPESEPVPPPAVEEPVTPPPVEPVTPPPVEPVPPPAAVEPVTPAVEEAEVPPPVEPVMAPPAVSPVVPPPPVEEAGTAEGAGAGESAEHEEARRFARLLVSEIKLYNPEEVERGRANNDIYQRLKDDIDRSREMYEKRISGEIRAEHDYFREALVRILADGDEDALGM